MVRLLDGTSTPTYETYYQESLREGRRMPRSRPVNLRGGGVLDGLINGIRKYKKEHGGTLAGGSVNAQLLNMYKDKVLDDTQNIELSKGGRVSMPNRTSGLEELQRASRKPKRSKLQDVLDMNGGRVYNASHGRQAQMVLSPY